MTDASVPSPRTPHEVLGDLTRRVRAVQRASWFPLLLLGALTLGAILVNRFTFSIRPVACPAIHPPADTVVLASCAATRQGSLLYWTLGLVLVYAATALFYIRRSTHRGVGTPVRPYVLAGIGVAVLMAAHTLWILHSPIGDPVEFWGLHADPGSGTAKFLSRLGGESAAIGLPLLVLSWVERNRALLLFTLAYLVIALAPITSGWSGIAVTSPWSALPGLAVTGVFLLLGALGFALAQLPRLRGES